MIVFGTRGKAVPGPRKQGVVCESCGKEEHATYGVLRWFHVFWIPVFPTMKQAVMECAHCKKLLRGKEVPERVRRDIAEKVFTRGRVLPLFSGLAVLVILVASAAWGSAERSKKESAFLAAPAVGDLYVVKLARFAPGADPKFPYGVLRVSGVAGSKLELQIGRYGYTQGSGADKAISSGQVRSADYFAPGPVSLDAQELEPLHVNGVIRSVNRR
jgi:hypothetical protein